MTLCTPCYNHEKAVSHAEIKRQRDADAGDCGTAFRKIKYQPSLDYGEACPRCGDDHADERHKMDVKRSSSSEDLSFAEYQERSKETAQGYAHPSYVGGKGMPEKKLLFLATAINGEAGELGEKIKKCVRECDASYLDDAEDEIGDVLWYLAQLASLLDVDLGEIAEGNLEKLLDRQERGKITGEGDSR